MIPSEILFQRLRERFDKVADGDTGFRAGSVDEAVAHMRTVIAAHGLHNGTCEPRRKPARN